MTSQNQSYIIKIILIVISIQIVVWAVEINDETNSTKVADSLLNIEKEFLHIRQSVINSLIALE